MNPITDNEEEENEELSGATMSNEDRQQLPRIDDGEDPSNHIKNDDLPSSARREKDESVDVETKSSISSSDFANRRGAHAAERITRQEATEDATAAKESPSAPVHNTPPTNGIQQAQDYSVEETNSSQQPTLLQQESTEEQQQQRPTQIEMVMSHDATTNANEIQRATVNDDVTRNHSSWSISSSLDDQDELIIRDDDVNAPTTFGQEEEKEEIDVLQTGNRTIATFPLHQIQHVETPAESISEDQHQQHCIPMAAAVLLTSPKLGSGIPLDHDSRNWNF